MRRRTLTELASNPDLISGIYNYCDRWCERCPLTTRCLVYATEQVNHHESPESQDIRNEAFWHKLSSVPVGNPADDHGVGRGSGHRPQPGP